MSILNNSLPLNNRARAAGMLVLGMLFGAPLAAQVGHPPAASPYSDLRASQILSFTGGYLAGSRGTAGVAPADGPILGARLDLFLGRSPVAFMAAFGGAKLDRVELDPTFGPANRLIDSVTQTVWMIDAGFMFNLTGRKTWRGFAPYLGATVGLALGGQVPGDSIPGQFRFETHFTAAPELGFSWHPTDRLNLRVSGRNVMWRVSHPLGFFSPPINAPGEPPILTDNDKRNQWLHHPTLVFGLGYAIRM